MSGSPALTDDDRERYGWQLDVPGFGPEGQARLKGSTALVTRVGGLGGVAAYELAAAGIGRLILAHAGNVRLSDLNRQLLMTHAALGSSRVECAARRLRELNPGLEVTAIGENASTDNAARLIAEADLVVDCAPLFDERLALNREIVRQRKPMIECAMYELEGRVTTIVPGRTPCLACLTPEPPPAWRRRFPVFGAVSGTIGCLAAMEAIKLLSGVGEPLLARLLCCDLRDISFRTLPIERRADCAVCAAVVSEG